MKAYVKRFIFLLLTCILSMSGFCAFAGEATGPREPENPVTIRTDNRSGKGTLTIGVRSEITNFSSYSKRSGRYCGFEVDLAKAIAEELGYAEVCYVTTHPETRESDLHNGVFDLAVACYTINANRKHRVDFSTPYYVNHETVIVERSCGYTQLADLKGKRIGIHGGALIKQHFIAASVKEGISFNADLGGFDYEFVEFSSYDEMFRQLETGELDALCIDGALAQPYMNEERKELKHLGAISYGIGVRKGNPLLEKVDKALENLVRSGTMDILKDKWF